MFNAFYNAICHFFFMATPSFSDWVPIVTSTSGAEFFVDDKTFFNTNKTTDHKITLYFSERTFHL